MQTCQQSISFYVNRDNVTSGASPWGSVGLGEWWTQTLPVVLKGGSHWRVSCNPKMPVGRGRQTGHCGSDGADIQPSRSCADHKRGSEEDL